MCEAIRGIIDEGKTEGLNRMLLPLACMGKNNELHFVSKLQDIEFLEQMYAKYHV